MASEGCRVDSAKRLPADSPFGAVTIVGRTMNEPEDLEALLRELHDEPTAPERGASPAIARDRGRRVERRRSRPARCLAARAGRPGAPAICCSSPARPPRSASTGASCRWAARRSTATSIEAAVLAALPPHAAAQYRDGGIADASFRLADVGRFRINLHRERGRAAAAIRAPAADGAAPRLARTCRPGVEALTRLPRGLVLIGGPTGSGKTTTLAALVDEINRRDARHIVTIEDPIEYEHPHRRSLIEQVEIGIDAPDFPTALRAALRQAPDVIVVGEMRDPETMRIALAAGGDRPPRVLERAHDRRRVDASRASPIRFRRSGRTPSARSWRWRWRR